MTQEEANELLIRIDERTEAMAATLDEMKDEDKALEKRVRSLERWRNYLVGAVASMGGAAGATVHKLLNP